MTAVVADLEATGPLPGWLRPVILAADPRARRRPGPWPGRPTRHRRQHSRCPLDGAARLRTPGHLHPQQPHPPGRPSVPDRDTHLNGRVRAEGFEPPRVAPPGPKLPTRCAGWCAPGLYRASELGRCRNVAPSCTRSSRGVAARPVSNLVSIRGSGPVWSRTPPALRFSATRDRSAGRARQGQSPTWSTASLGSTVGRRRRYWSKPNGQPEPVRQMPGLTARVRS
jgi:hypothetical protein